MSYSYFPHQPTYTINSTSVTSGSVLTSGSNGTVSWNTITDNQNLKPASLQVKGTAEFEHDVTMSGDLKIQGKSIKESLDKIEDRLAILHTNEELEEKWENLRGLRKMYMELEAEIIEKEKMWAILKK